MEPYSPSRLARRALLVGVLAIGASFLLSACAGTDTEQDMQVVAQVEAGDLTGFDVDIHQAVG